MYTLQYKNLEIQVVFKNDDNAMDNMYFQFLDEDGFIKRICIAGSNPNPFTKQISLSSIEQIVSTTGKIGDSKKRDDVYISDSGKTYNMWFDYLTNNNTKGGEFWFKPTFDGILADCFKDKNLRCWNTEKGLEFVQPVIFDITSTDNSITANVYNKGNGIVLFSINGGLNWQELNIFEGLQEETEYTILAKTDIDLQLSYQKIKTLKNIEIDE